MSTAMTNIETHIDDRGVATVTLSREQKHNAFDDQMITELTSAFTEIAQSSAKVMILTAKGKSFSAGADLGWMQRMADYTYEENLQDAQGLALMMKTLNDMPMTTIAKVDGAAFGGALGLICCCDIAIGSDKSMFCLSEVKIGLIPATISPYVIAAIGQRAAIRYFQTAEAIDASTAVRIGLLSEITSSELLDAKTDQVIKALLNNSPQAVRAAKQLVFDVHGQELSDELIQDTTKRIAMIRTTEEGQEGLKAFLEKRPATWRVEHINDENIKVSGESK